MCLAPLIDQLVEVSAIAGAAVSFLEAPREKNVLSEIVQTS